MLEFHLFKIPIRVEAEFWIVMGLFGFMINQNAAGNQMFLMIALFMMAGFISILIHELGHALMVKKYKLPTQIRLSLFHGSASHPSGILNRKQTFLVILCGPLLQATFGASIYFLTPHLGLEANLLSYFIETLIGISIYWSVLNCIPVLPLDGGRMLEIALGPKRIKLTLTISMISAVIMCIICFSIGAFFFGVFMAMFAFQSYQALERINKF